MYVQSMSDQSTTKIIPSTGSRTTRAVWQTLIVVLIITLIGVLVLWAVVATQGASIGPWALVIPVFVVGLGMGTCFGTLFDIEIGDIDPEEAGSASGALSAVQQLAGSIGSAVITLIWFGRISGNHTSAMVACLIVVIIVITGCYTLVGLLPHKAQEGHFSGCL